MYLPYQEENLVQIATEAHERTASLPKEQREHAVHLHIINPDIISHYVAEKLSDPDYLNADLRHMKDKAAMRALVDSPELHRTFALITDILEEYFNDMCIVAAEHMPESDIEQFSRGLEGVAAQGVLFRGRLISIMQEFKEKAGQNVDKPMFEASLDEAQDQKIFLRNSAVCPMKFKIDEICSTVPHRDPETGKVTIIGNEPGALPAFIHNEIENEINSPATKQAAKDELRV